MVALAPYRQAVINFSTPIILGLATALFWQGDWRHSILTVGICLYGVVNLQFGLYLNRLLSDALRARLLGNLIHNALKFTPLGGVVVLARSSGNNISLEVWDTGCGIDPAESSRIFDEFCQVGNQKRDRAKGLGAWQLSNALRRCRRHP